MSRLVKNNRLMCKEQWIVFRRVSKSTISRPWTLPREACWGVAWMLVRGTNYTAFFIFLLFLYHVLCLFINKVQRLHAAQAMVKKNLCDKPKGAREKTIHLSPSGLGPTAH